MSRRPAVAALALVALLTPLVPAHGAAPATISGAVYQDLDRDKVQDPGETALSGKQVYLVDATGNDVARTVTDATGRYAFAGLAPGGYRVQYDSLAWWDIRSEWVLPDALRPDVPVSVGEGEQRTLDLAWRRITRSTDVDRPITAWTGPEGLRVHSYDDVVTAREVYDAVKLGLVQAEASRILVRFDWGATSDTATSVGRADDGTYSGYRAAVNVSYLSWLDRGDETLSHEYGHAWSLYYAYEVRQDPSMASYLQARGLAGDSRVNSGYAWSVRELIADDYRQLFGSANARSGSPLNRDIPPAAEVPGLAAFLRDTFTAAAGTAPAPSPPPAPLAVSGPAASPQLVKTTTDISFSVSAPASARLTVEDSKGTVVRTLYTGSVTGSVTQRWDRTTDAGRRVKSGTYTVRVVATASGSTAVSTTTVRV